MGGEKTKKIYGKDGKKGSPPRGRGKATVALKSRIAKRITPAWAGKRLWRRASIWGGRDHPRVGGEKHQDESSVMELQGSPPRGRGKGPHHKHCHPFHRITPAWAGKSTAAKHCASGIRDHPRVDGEKLIQQRHCSQRQGSPPHERGKDAVVAVVVRGAGITPA